MNRVKMSDVERIKSLTSAIEEKCPSDRVEYLAARAYLAAWATETVNGSEWILSRPGLIPEGRIIDEATVKFLRIAMGFSHIEQLVQYANEAIVKEWQRVRPSYELTWHARVLGFTDEPEYEAIGIDTLRLPEYPRGVW